MMDEQQEERRSTGFTVLLSGLSGAGKSTIALALRSSLMQAGRRHVKVLDGEMFRFSTSCDEGHGVTFSSMTALRMAQAAAQITRAGGVAVCAAVAPSEHIRERARRAIETSGRFILVYLSTPLRVCEERDCKGLYRSARAGLIGRLTGITAPYEIPLHPNLTIDTSVISVDAAVGFIVRYLRSEALIGAGEIASARDLPTGRPTVL
jgi:sulfate adenylyltransferase